jgi:predicted O-methyltransferase YrrM
VIVDERMVTYLNSLEEGNSELLNVIEQEALRDFVPIIRPQMQSFLRVLLSIKRPVRILEVGTAVGFSTLLLCEYAPRESRITTIEKFEKRIPIARNNFKRAGKENQITLLEGDAMEILAGLDTTYDFIFMDAAKGQYINYLPHILRILEPQGLLVSDNVLQEGDIIESRFAVEKRNRTIYRRMREYLYELKHNKELLTSIIPLGDGVTISTKISE